VYLTIFAGIGSHYSISSGGLHSAPDAGGGRRRAADAEVIMFRRINRVHCALPFPALDQIRMVSRALCGGRQGTYSSGGFYLIFPRVSENVPRRRPSKSPGTRRSSTWTVRPRSPSHAGCDPLSSGTPLALGSYWGLVPMAAMIHFSWRLLAEGNFLARNRLDILTTERSVVALCHSCAVRQGAGADSGAG
jgi:hypothetical protein